MAPHIGWQNPHAIDDLDPAVIFDASSQAFRPADHGLLGWTVEPANATGSTVLPTAGLVNVCKMHWAKSALVTNILTTVITAGAVLTAGQCFAGIYQNGALLGTTVDQAVAWASTGNKTMVLAAPVTITPGDLYIASFFNGTTGPALKRAASDVGVNIGLAAAASRFATADAGRTTTLAAALGALTAQSNAYFFGLS